ncbi:uncharacterized protein LOC144175660 [Haemaphysalis longicornis]
MVSDKEGGFVVLPKGDFSEKAQQAITKNFISVKCSKKQLRNKAMALCDEINLQSLKKTIAGAKKDFLDMFFSAKTHKEGIPFRAIVTEKDSWQGTLSRFLKRHLKLLKVNDPYLVPNSDSVLTVITEYEYPQQPLHAFSIDVVDLFYSIPQRELFCAVRESIDDFGPEGICIGSCIAPILSDLFLSFCDKHVNTYLDTVCGAKVLNVFRYVDDYLVMLKDVSAEDLTETVSQVLGVFNSCGKGLKFTFQLPEEGCLQFLDLSIFFHDGQVCWRYQPRSKKPVLYYDSAHSKIVKRGIAKHCMRAALKKSCCHQVRPVIVPYVHNLSHRLKKVTGRCGTQVVFSAPGKLARMCKAVNNESGKAACTTKHATRFMECVVYRIPLDCGRCYVGQTGRCINDRLREHRAAVNSLVGGGHLADHCRRCTCTPDFHNTRVLRSFRTQLQRKIFKAFCIFKGKKR